MIPQKIAAALSGVLGEDGFSTRPEDLERCSRDSWTRLMLLERSRKRPDWTPEAVCFPRSREQLAEVLAICHREGVSVVPRGGGTGLCGGAVPISGGIVVEMGGLARIGPLDEIDQVVHVQAGCLGVRLESFLNQRGLTLGHVPGSMERATVGGWIATRSGGVHSSKYGKIEDLVIGLEILLPDGRVLQAGPGIGPGVGMPDWRNLWLGGEGTLGVVTGAALKVFPLPPVRRVAAFRFLEMENGLEAMRGIMQAGLRPSLLRLYDPWATLMHDYLDIGDPEWQRGATEPPWRILVGVLRRVLQGDIPQIPRQFARMMARLLSGHSWAHGWITEVLPLSSLLVIGFAGDEKRTRLDLGEAREIAVRASGRQLSVSAAEHWATRHPLLPEDLAGVFGRGAFADTIEVSGMWRDIPRIHQKTRRVLLPDVAVMTTFEHARREGCACSFTAFGQMVDRTPERTGLLSLYDRCVERALRTAMANGASLSHHLGVGMLRRELTTEEYPGGSRLFWALKAAADPHSVMNPGKVHPTTVGLPVREEGDRPFQVDLPTMLAWEDRSRPPEDLFPEMPEEVVDWVALARRRGWRLVPPESSEGSRKARRGPEVIRLHLDRLDQVIDFDPVSETITVQAGMTLMQVENYLRERGFTLGFAPRRELDRTVGHLLGHYPPTAGSPLYGTLRRNCLGLSAVLADGTLFRQRPAPRRSVGPDLMHLLLGTRGCLGLITAACLRIFPKPPVREIVAFGGDDPEVALAAIRTLLIREARPEWALVVIRSPREMGNRRRIRTVLQVAGTRAQVSADLEIVRQVMDPLGFDPEPIRPETRPRPPERRMPFLEGFLSMKDLGKAARILGSSQEPSCPQAHMTHFTVQGATLRLLIREPEHRYPELIEAMLRRAESRTATEFLAAIKENLDPWGVFPALEETDALRQG